MCRASFVRVSVDHSVFIKQNKLGQAVITVHVNDMAAAASNMATLHETVKDLQKIIDIVDMGPIKWFLGMSVTCNHSQRMISLSQTTYIDTILKCFNMTDAYTVSTLMDPNVTLSKAMSPTSSEDKEKMTNIPYLAGIGLLMYASMGTRPDITFATNKLSQYNADPGLAHWTALQRLPLPKKNQKPLSHPWGKGDSITCGIHGLRLCWMHRLMPFNFRLLIHAWRWPDLLELQMPAHCNDFHL